MIRFRRSAQAKNDKFFLDGVRIAKEVAEYINAKYAPVSVQVYTELFGNFNTIHWYIDYKDLATLESISKQLLADQEYLAIVSKGDELSIEGSIHDTLMRSL